MDNKNTENVSKINASRPPRGYWIYSSDGEKLTLEARVGILKIVPQTDLPYPLLVVELYEVNIEGVIGQSFKTSHECINQAPPEGRLPGLEGTSILVKREEHIERGVATGTPEAVDRQK